MSIKYQIIIGNTERLFNTIEDAEAFSGGRYEIIPIEVEEPAAVKDVPQQITMWQLRAAITLSGLKDELEAKMQQLPEPTKTVAFIAWEYANNILRFSPTVIAIQQLLGLSDEQVDDLFIMGNNIDA